MGRDVFISYSRRDATPYARQLALDLESAPRGQRLTSFVDQRAALIDEHLPEEIIRAVRRASMLVVVASPGAAVSRHVRTEIAMFESARRPVVVVACEPEVPNVALSEFLDNLRQRAAVIIPESYAALQHGPTRPVINAIRDAVGFVRHDRRILVSALTVGFALSLFVAIMSWKIRADGQEIENTRDDGLVPGFVVIERKTVLNLQGWQPTTAAELAARRKKSKAVSVNHFLVRRTKRTPTRFVHVMGTSSGIMPEFVNRSPFLVKVVARKVDETTRAPHEWSIEFDVSDVQIGKSFPIDFTVTFWNAFQTPAQLWGGYRILHQTREMVYEIHFPDGHYPMPESIRYVAQADTHGEEPFGEKVMATMVHDASQNIRSISWRAFGPIGNTSYRIKWSWTQ